MSTRDRILDAAAEVVRTRGLARATTKEIARAADCSEATLYKHFQDKTEIFMGVLAERLPQFVTLTKELSHRVGVGSVRDNLATLARAAVEFYAESVPIASALFAEPRLLATHRAGLRRAGAGPHRANDALATYLRAEQELGRVSPDVDPAAAAALLIGACFQHAFLHRFMGTGFGAPQSTDDSGPQSTHDAGQPDDSRQDDSRQTDDDFADAVADTVARILVV